MKVVICLIRSKISKADWWSNEHGWCNIEDATVFTEQESYLYDLPLDGMWVYFIEE